MNSEKRPTCEYRTRPTARRNAARRFAPLFAVLAALCAAQAARAQEETSRLKRLVEQVARGDEVESAAATEQLIEQFTEPLAEAIGPMSSRPVEEQMRLRRAMARLIGAVRMRVFRIDLPAEERKLVDEFAKTYPELTERLFDGDWRVRRAAVQQIPLEPDTGAGVLVAAKVDDEDEMVASAALEMAAQLRDAVVARNLARYIQDATETIRSGFYGPQDQDIAITLAVFVFRSLRVVASVAAPENTPVVIDAVGYFARSRYWDQPHRAAALGILGELDDKHGASILLDLLDDPNPLRWQSGENKQRLTETVGDVALLNLLRLYKLEPGEFGLQVLANRGDFAGYPDEESRQAGHRAFRVWYQQHVEHESVPLAPACGLYGGLWVVC